jgi:hypothetical protein
MTTLVEGKHPGGFLVWEAFRDYTRETITIAAGTLEPGTVLGRITASGKYAAHDPAATDGTEPEQVRWVDTRLRYTVVPAFFGYQSNRRTSTPSTRSGVVRAALTPSPA